MASTAALELIVKLDDKASKGLDNIADKGGKVGKSFGSMIGPATLLTGGIGLLGAGLFNAAQAAADEEAGMARLQKTLANSVDGYNEATGGVEDYIAKQEKLAFADDELRDSLGFLVGQTKDLSEAQELQATAMDLARAKGISLEAATKAVGKVDQESIGILKKLGIQVTENMTKEEALTAIRSASAGQAEAYAKSTAGQMELMQNTIGNAIEDIGVVVLPALTAAFGFVSGAIGTLMPILGGLFNFLTNEGKPVLVAIAIAIGSVLVPALIGWATTMLTVTLPAFLAMMAPILVAAAPFIAIGAAVAALWFAFENNFLGIRDMVLAVWGAVEPALNALGEMLGATLVNAWNLLKDAALFVWQQVLQPAFEFLSGPVVAGAVSWLGNALGTTLVVAWNLLKDAALFLWNQVMVPFWEFFGGPVVSGAIAFLSAAMGTTLVVAWNLLKDAATFLWNQVMVPFWAFLSGPIVSGAISFIGTAVGATLVTAWNALKVAGLFLWNNVMVPFWAFMGGPIVSGVLTFIGTAVGTTLVAAWNALKTAGEFLWNNVMVPFFAFLNGDTVRGVLTFIGTAIGGTLVTAWNALKEVATFLWNNVLKPFFDFLGGAAVKGAVKVISDGVGGTISGAFNVLKLTAQTVGGIIRGVIDGIVWAVQQAQAALNALDAHQRSSSKALQDAGLGILAPGRAVGGPVRSGSPYLVGEEGPELFIPRMSGTIIPNDRLMRNSRTALMPDLGASLDAALSTGERVGREMMRGWAAGIGKGTTELRDAVKRAGEGSLLPIMGAPAFAVSGGSPSSRIGVSSGEGFSRRTVILDIDVNNPASGAEGFRIGRDIVRILEDAGLHDRLINP